MYSGHNTRLQNVTAIGSKGHAGANRFTRMLSPSDSYVSEL